MLKTYTKNSIIRTNKITEEILAVVELQNNGFILNILNAPREQIRKYLKEKIPTPKPVGNDNMLNKFFENGKTLLHESVSQNKYDITELFLSFGADVNIKANGKTMAHIAAETNNTNLLGIIIAYKGDLSLYNNVGGTPLQAAIAFNNYDVLKALWLVCKNLQESEEG